MKSDSTGDLKEIIYRLWTGVATWGMNELLLSYPPTESSLSSCSVPYVEALNSAFAPRCWGTTSLVSLPMFTQSSGISKDVNRESNVTSATLEMGVKNKAKNSLFSGSKRRRGKRRREREQKRSGLQRKEHVALYFN